MKLLYLYVGTNKIDDDLAKLKSLGANEIWRFQKFGADVGAVEFGDETRLILADHRPVGSVMPIYQVDSIRGIKGHTAETPDGPCVVVQLPSGVEVGFLEVHRPKALEGR
jgi:hypothetical protein